MPAELLAPVTLTLSERHTLCACAACGRPEGFRIRNLRRFTPGPLRFYCRCCLRDLEDAAATAIRRRKELLRALLRLLRRREQQLREAHLWEFRAEGEEFPKVPKRYVLRRVEGGVQVQYWKRGNPGHVQVFRTALQARFNVWKRLRELGRKTCVVTEVGELD